jgi:hypothetical protein
MMDEKGFQEALRDFLAHAATILATTHRFAAIRLCAQNTCHLAPPDWRLRRACFHATVIF